MSFNNQELDKIELLLRDRRYNDALRSLNNYASKYDDYTIPVLYAEILYRLGDYKEAKDYLKTFRLNSRSNNKLTFRYYLLSVKLDMELGDYEHALNTYMMARRKADKTGITGGYAEMFTSSSIFFFLKERAGYLKEDEIREDSSYLLRQIKHYDRNEAIENIKNNKNEYNTFNSHSYQFVDSIDIEELFNTIESSMENTHSYYNSPLFRERIFQYDKCGITQDGEYLDYIVVYSFYDSDRIMFFSPTVKRDKMESTDITPIEDHKVKRLSAMDKFNKKYGLK